MGILFGLQYFKKYHDGIKFKVITDHASLRNLRNPTGRLARWIVKLNQYDFDVEYKKGKLMVVPDELSRLPTYD